MRKIENKIWNESDRFRRKKMHDHCKIVIVTQMCEAEKKPRMNRK